MADFGDMTHPVGRKDHRCEYCWGLIPKGEKHPQYKGMWDNEWQNWRMHGECYADYVDNCPADGFCPGEAEKPERIKLLMAARTDSKGEAKEQR